MSDKNIQNEDALWDLLSTEPGAEAKAARPESKAPKFAAPEPEIKATTEKPARKIDGFFVACMAGVAAVSVAATLLVSSMFGGNAATPPPKNPVIPVETHSSPASADLEQENAELRAQLEQQKKQIKDLQADLIELMGSEEFLATVPSNPGESDEVTDARVKAYELFAEIQEAYADFDRDRLDELIPQMDEMITYLSPEALNNYYLILEYVEQPSNG